MPVKIAHLLELRSLRKQTDLALNAYVIHCNTVLSSCDCISRLHFRIIAVQHLYNDELE